MAKLPTISLVTPSYNQAEYLEQTIQSVLSQGYPHLEYSIIDGGSTDGSVQIIKKYSRYLHHWESKKDRGQSHAINKGFSHSTGSVMGWINSDDILKPGSLQLVGSIFAQCKEIEWLTGLPATINYQGYQLYQAQPPLYISSLIRKGWYIRKLLGFIMQEGTFWRRSLWKKSGGSILEVPYSMDFKLWQAFAEHTSLYCVHTQLASYRLNPNRKNNDGHQKYYQEINAWIPEKIGMVGKFIWRQIAKTAHYLQVAPALYFSEQDNQWYFRKRFSVVQPFKLLGNGKPRK